MLSLVRDYLDTLFDRVKKEISVLRADILFDTEIPFISV